MLGSLLSVLILSSFNNIGIYIFNALLDYVSYNGSLDKRVGKNCPLFTLIHLLANFEIQI